MDYSVTDLLTIQKFIFLLDEFHYQQFTAHLKNINATLPLKLAEEVWATLPEFDTHEVLCNKIYGGFDKTQKQNFNQLSSYTFRLSFYLVQNYPGYLFHNVPKLQHLVNDGRRKEAKLLSEVLHDISERVEDFPILINVLNFLSQEAFMMKDTTRGFKLNKQLEDAVETQRLYIQIQSNVRRNLNMDEPIKDRNELDVMKAYYNSFQDHPSASIRIISQYGYLSNIYQHDPKMFGDKKDFEKIIVLEKDLKNNGYLALPFLSDFKGHIGYLKLNSGIWSETDTPDEKKVLDELAKHYESVKFWRNYLNLGEMYLMAVYTTRLLAMYHHYIHRADYHHILKERHANSLKNLLKKCEDYQTRYIDDDRTGYAIRNIKMIYGILLMISGGEKIKEGIDVIEGLLISYQQVNFKSAHDSIFLGLMIGYFSIGDYEKCAATFKRYLKSVKGKPLYQGNDISIHTYYYVSQWIATKSRQYVNKLNALMRVANAEGFRTRGLRELISYFNVPVTVPVAPNV